MEKHRNGRWSGRTPDEYEAEILLPSQDQHTSRYRQSRLLSVSLLFNGLGLVTIAILGLSMSGARSDPGLAIYSPANSAVEYIDRLHFRAALFNETPYMGFPNQEKDRLWGDLYNFGISRISKEEAAQLSSPTMQIPGTQDYVIELDVYHELHCLNDLRKILYPEYYPDMALSTMRLENGTFDRDNDMFRHWDHCIDSIRQTLMCHADVAPIPFHINVPVSKGIFPRLATTHTCRNFDKIKQWAIDHSAGEWKFMFDSDEEAQAALKHAPPNQGPEEDIQFLYYLFPGNQYFDFWKTHSVDEIGADSVNKK